MPRFKQPMPVHPFNICMMCVFRVAETSFRFTLRHFCLLESNGPNHSGSNIRYDPLPFIHGRGSSRIKEVNKEVGSATPIRKYECVHFSDWPYCNSKRPFFTFAGTNNLKRIYLYEWDAFVCCSGIYLFMIYFHLSVGPTWCQWSIGKDLKGCDRDLIEFFSLNLR